MGGPTPCPYEKGRWVLAIAKALAELDE